MPAGNDKAYACRLVWILAGDIFIGEKNSVLMINGSRKDQATIFLSDWLVDQPG